MLHEVLVGSESSLGAPVDMSRNDEVVSALRKCEERLRLAMRTAGMGFWEWDISGRKDVPWIYRSHELCGLPVELFDVVYKDFLLTSLHPDDRVLVHKTILRASIEGGNYEIEFRVLWPTGGVHWLVGRGQVFNDEHGRPARMIIAIRDITEKKEAEALARESEKAQRDFIANISHEFRTPVAAIKGFAETLIRGGLEDSKNRRRFVRIIDRHADRLGWLIEEVLTISTLEGGAAQLNLAPIKLSKFVRDYLLSIRTLIRARDISVSVAIPATLRASADEHYLRQVLENVLSNAIKYNRRGGWIRVEASSRPEGILVSVRDGGVGIGVEDLRRVFDRFYRVEKGASNGNTGLGLYIVKKIVEAHGGRLWAESILGKGSSFHFTLPG
jgi:PAS domain S-box-containing protein